MNLSDMSQFVGIPMFNVDEDGVHPANDIARELVSCNHDNVAPAHDPDMRICLECYQLLPVALLEDLKK